MHGHRQRTGVGPRSLLAGAENIPAGLTDRIIGGWLINGHRTRNARRDHLEFVLNRWAGLPNAPDVPITAEILAELHTHQTRTGIWPTALLKQADNLPKGLKPAMILDWLSERSKTAKVDHLDYVLCLWAALPNHPYLGRARVPIAPDTLEELRQLRHRSGLGPQAIMRGAKDAPAGLASDIIKDWMDGSVDTAPQEYLDYVLERWRSVPRRVPITDEMRDTLRAMKSTTGISPGRLLRDAEDAPEGLSPLMVQQWIDGKRKTLNPEHFDYVLKRWRNLPDRMAYDGSHVVS